MMAARKRGVMSFLRKMSGQIDGAKIKMSVLLGLALGLFLTFGSSSKNTPAQGS